MSCSARRTASLAAACPFYRPRGLAVEGNRLAIAAANELFVFANVDRIARELPDRPNHFDAVFVPRTMHFIGYCDLHDMAFDGPVILAVNTLYSCICVIDGQYNFTPIWQPPFITALAAEDRCHLNGMAFADRRVRYVTMLGASDQQKGWRSNMVDGGLLMEGDRLYVLEGGRGRVLEVDASSGATRVLASGLPGFAHGLAEHRGVLFVGLSKLRDRRGPRGLPIEEGDQSLMAGTAAIDLATGQLIGTFEFLSGVEEIYDIQVMPDIRRPEIRSAAQWFQNPSVVVPNGGLWLPGPFPVEADEQTFQEPG